MNTYKLSFSDRLLVLLATALTQILGWTLRIKEEGQSQWGPRGKQEEAPLWALWHETILMSVWYHRDQDVRVLISPSRDGELVSALARFYGYTPVRGSSSRGGMEGARRLVGELKDQKRSAITPDGPRGPRRVAQEGVVTVARLAGCPVVPFAFNAENCWRLKSWDRFIIPKPFSRAVFVYGNPIRVPRRGSEEVDFLGRIQSELDRVTDAAENYFKETSQLSPPRRQDAK